MTARAADLARFVRDRAENRCEYCRMHQSLQVATFHIEHVVPEVVGGLTEGGNLALACPTCNLKKGKRVIAVDPMTGATVAFFNPRNQAWDDNFEWSDIAIVGTTAIGRAAISAPDLNHDRRKNIRKAERAFGLFPPAKQQSGAE
jgi:hypothetical protein